MKILASIIMLLTAFNVYAAVDCVVVYDKAGKQEIIPIKEAGEITFSSQTMNVGTYDFLLDNLSKYEFADSESLGIEEISGDISGIKIDPSGLITFPMAIAEEVRVYNTHGIKCNVNIRDNEIDMRSLPTEVYLVKVGNSSIKFLKK